VTRPLVEIEDFSVGFAGAAGTVKALRNVALTIERHRIVGIVGESGSGKSTLALALIGLLPANTAERDGRIIFDGTDIGRLSHDAARRLRGDRIAMIFQDPMSALNPVFTIGTQLVDAQRTRHPGLSKRELRERAATMLEHVGIADARARIDAYPHQLSGGMRQRVMIAMALLAEPELLIADEPTTALDVTVEAQIVGLLRDLRREIDGSILFVSHSLGLIAELCDEVVVMYAGTVVETAPTAELFASPHHPYTLALLACEIRPEDPPEGRLLSIPGEVPNLVEVPPGCIFAARCPSVMPRCRVERPPLMEVAAGHRSACWLA
jgi:peptide/nickel transport system ATP-binding protein